MVKLMKELVIFCESYDEIENALYLVTHNYQDHSITIAIPGNHDLFKFFEEVNNRVLGNKINIIYFAIYYEAKPGDNMVTSWIRRLNVIGEKLYLRRIYKRYFSRMTGAEVYFFCRDFTQYDFYFLRKLSKRNKLVYMYFGRYTDGVSKYTPSNIIDWVMFIRLKLVYGSDIAMGWIPCTKPFARIPDKFMKGEVDKVIDREERNEIIKDFDLSRFKIFDAGDYSIIYFDQPLVEMGYVSEEAFKRDLNKIFNILRKHFPETEIARKYHPKFSGGKAMVKIGDILPDFIPGELLHNDNIEMYLSPFSCAIANVEEGAAISIIDLISFKDDETRQQLKEVLIQMSHSEILFPKSLDEFEKIIIDIKEKAKRGVALDGEEAAHRLRK